MNIPFFHGRAGGQNDPPPGSRDAKPPPLPTQQHQQQQPPPPPRPDQPAEAEADDGAAQVTPAEAAAERVYLDSLADAGACCGAACVEPVGVNVSVSGDDQVIQECFHDAASALAMPPPVPVLTPPAYRHVRCDRGGGSTLGDMPPVVYEFENHHQAAYFVRAMAHPPHTPFATTVTPVPPPPAEGEAVRVVKVSEIPGRTRRPARKAAPTPAKR